MRGPITDNRQFVTDASGRQTAVIVPIAEYEELMEDLADLAIAAERSQEVTLPHAEAVAQLAQLCHFGAGARSIQATI
jgi:PHD/YefM family antitoxin component YafN of YafNO toxin-antitoxin module